MKYLEYQSSDFIEDDNFRNWVLNPDENTHDFWQSFLREFPEKHIDIDIARRLLLTIKAQEESNFSTQEYQNKVFQQIVKQIKNEKNRFKSKTFNWMPWAASVVFVLSIGVWYALKNKPVQILTYEQIRLDSDLKLIEKINNTNEPIFLSLLDGSFIELQPNSKVSYLESFETTDKREVLLSGEAFFKVFHNPNKPFYVYTNELVTKVLGTSFNIKAYSKDKNITVRVSSGRVQVAVTEKLRLRPKKTSSITGIFLDANQQVVISRKELRLRKPTTFIPKIIPLIPDKSPTFKFDSTSVSKVFNELEEAYHVKVNLDKIAFANCHLTADLSNESLNEKLDIICKSIEADYDILDDQIIITGKGCNF